MFLFGHIQDRDNVLERITTFLGQCESCVSWKDKSPVFAEIASHQNDEIISQIEKRPLSDIFGRPENENQTLFQNNRVMMKDKMWDMHENEFGLGISMYRTSKTRDLVQKGIPPKYRAQIWLIFSGAGNMLESHEGYYASLCENSQWQLGQYLVRVNKQVCNQRECS